jgi:hypothetical protein
MAGLPLYDGRGFQHHNLACMALFPASVVVLHDLIRRVKGSPVSAAGLGPCEW